jgi:hypothetical protein
MMKRGLCLAVLLAAVGLTGCAGVFNGLSEDPMSMIKMTKSTWDPRTGEDPITYPQIIGVQDLAQTMKIQLDWQTTTALEAGASEFLPYGVAGSAGGASTGILYQSARALTAPAAGVTGLVYGFGGFVNGVITASYANVHALSTALEKAMRDHEREGKKYLDQNGKSLFHNLHVEASFTRSRNAMNSPAPGLMRGMMRQQPRWSGPAAGYPRQ